MQLKINPVKVVFKQINIKTFGHLLTFSLLRLKEVKKKNKKEKNAEFKCRGMYGL